MGKARDGLGYSLSQVSVRPVRDAAERAEWDRVMDTGHYLGFRGMFGGGLRHVAAGPDGQWLALLGWCSGAFKAQARDGWIGWAAEQQFRRLHLVANNCRFLVLPAGRVRNLASRVLALSVRRLSGDMETLFGHPVLLAETFVDPSRFKGTCYLAANWTSVGQTKGFAAVGRRLGRAWAAEGDVGAPAGARRAGGTRGLDEPASWGCGRGQPEVPSAGRLRSLFDCLRGVPEFRSARGVRHSLASVLAVYGGGEARRGTGGGRHSEFAQRLDQPQLAAVRALQPDDRAIASIHRILSALDPDASMRRCGTSRRRAKRPTGPWPSTASRPRSTARAAPTRTGCSSPPWRTARAWWRGRSLRTALAGRSLGRGG